jgi:hypothetical protein
MAKRRSRLPRNLALLGVVAAVGWAAWTYWPGPQRKVVQGPSADDACALAPAPVLAQMIGRAAVEARRMASARGVPAVSACSWAFFGGRAEARLFTAASLAQAPEALSPEDYFRSVVTGLEYEFKAPPVVLSGIGDQAVAAGFDGAGDVPQIVVRRGDRVLALQMQGLDRTAGEAFASALAARL